MNDEESNFPTFRAIPRRLFKDHLQISLLNPNRGRVRGVNLLTLPTPLVSYSRKTQKRLEL